MRQRRMRERIEVAGTFVEDLCRIADSLKHWDGGNDYAEGRVSSTTNGYLAALEKRTLIY